MIQLPETGNIAAKARNLILAFFCILSYGCATNTASFAPIVGTPVDFEKVRTIEVGMNEQQLLDIMGNPYSITTQYNNQQMWLYHQFNTFTGATKWVLFTLQNGVVTGIPYLPKSLK